MGKVARFFSIILLITTAISHWANANVVLPADYPFPLKNPLIATLSSTANHSLHQIDEVTIEYRKDRRRVATLEGRNNITLGLFAKKNQTAPLMIVISGLGGDATSGSSELLADEFNAMGFHAVTVPNPFSWGYVLGASESTLPGYVPRDAREYYQFLQFVVSELKRQRHLKISGFAVSGYSLGGLVTAFLMNEDNSQHKFNFQKAIIINPAYDMNFGISRLDALYHNGDGFSDNKKNIIMGRIYDLAEKLADSPNPIAGLIQASGLFNDQQLSWVIGDSFRRSLSEVILTSQQIHDLGILKTPMSEYRRDGRIIEARAIGYVDYMKKFVAPSLVKSERLELTEQEYMKLGSLFALNDMLGTDKRIFIFENSDDLIVNAEHIENMKTILGDRFYLYPNGGHIGNLWFERNQKDLFQALSI